MANNKVLIVGGDHHGWWSGMLGLENSSGSSGTGSIEGADLYDPISQAFDLNSETWRYGLGQVLGTWAVGAGVTPRIESLMDGRVLLTYGNLTDEGYGTTSKAGAPIYPNNSPKLIDPNSLTTTATGPFKLSRFQHSLTRLLDGRVLAVGGKDYTQARFSSSSQSWHYQTTNTAEIYDPTTNVWTTTTGSLNQSRAYHSAVLLPSGQVLIVGGFNSDLDGNVTYPNDVELFDPSTNTFSVMDTLDYGLSSPQLALLNDGSVFVAGQVRAPMDPPPNAGNPQGLKMMASDRVGSTWTNGSSLFGLLSPGGWAVANPVVNQGVEIVGKVINGSTFAPMSNRIWKNVPLIVDRPALTKLTVWCGNTWDKEVPVKIEILGDSSFAAINAVGKPEKRGLLGGYKPSNKFLIDAFVIPQANVKANLTLKLTLQPPGITPEELNLTIPFQVAPPLNVDLVPVDYVYKDAAGVRQQYTLSAVELNTFQTSLLSTLKELYPNSLGQVNVNVQSFRAVWSEDGKDLAGAPLWQVDPSNPSVTFSNLLASSSSARAQKWLSLETYFFQQMTVEPAGSPSTPAHYSWAFPKNRYVIGVVPVIAGTTIPSTAGTAYTAGGALTGECQFVVALNQSALDSAHELGHAHGRKHSPYGAVDNADSNWPIDPAYSGAAIGVPGWNVIGLANSPDKPASKKDLMCYPDDRSMYWISDYNFYWIFQWELQSQQAGDR